MPEGPEVARSTNRLIDVLKPDDQWMTFLGIDKLGHKYDEVDIDLLSRCVDKPIHDIHCKGKEYFLRLSKDTCIWAHHMRAGEWLIGNIDHDHHERGKNIHFKLYFASVKDGVMIGDPVAISFYNPSFGKFEILTDEEAYVDKLNRLAPSFIGRFCHTEESWMEMFVSGKFTKRRLLIKLLRDDQRACCSGIGNYLIAEIFYVMRFHPKITVGELDGDTWLKLYHVATEVITGHYEGTRQKVIYKKDKSPNGNQIIGEHVSGRTMWWVPKEQLPLPE